MKTFNDLTNDQLDSIYYNTIGYRPISEDNCPRAEVIEILTNWKQDTDDEVIGLFSFVKS